MPELPEVETVRRGLLKTAAKRKINTINVYHGKTVTNDVEDFRQALIGRTVENVNQRGKYPLFCLTNNLTMTSHLRMKGKYYSQPIGGPIDKYIHAIFEFTDGTELYHQDTCKFGRMTLIKAGDEADVGGLKTTSPESTEDVFALPYFAVELKKSRGKIKPFLPNQRHVAGLGNIYVDGVLWMTGINPEQPANTLTTSQVTELRKNIIKELATAIKYERTAVCSFTNVLGDTGAFQGRLKAYGHMGNGCPCCSMKMARVKVTERGTTFCPHCQVLKG